MAIEHCAQSVPRPHHCLRAWMRQPGRFEQALRGTLVGAILVTLALTGIALWANYERQQFNVQLRQGHQAIDRLGVAAEATALHIAEFRAWLLMGGEAAQRRAETARERAHETLDELRRHDGGDAARLAFLTELQQALERFDVFAAEAGALLRRDGQAAAIARVRGGHGIVHIEAMRAKLAGLELLERQSLAGLEAEAARRERLVIGFSTAALLLQMLLSALGYAALRAEMRRRERAAAALAVSEARFRSLTEMSSDFYWETDAEHRMTKRTEFGENPSALGPHGWHGKPRWETPSESPGAEGWRAHRAMLDAHVPFRGFEFARRDHRDGRMRYFSVSGDPVFEANGRFTGYRGVGSEITDRKLAEAALRESEDRYRTLLEMSPEAVLVSRDGTILLANSAAARLFGAAQASDLLGTAVIERVHPDSRPLVERRLRAFANGSPVQPLVEQKYLRLDGKPVDVEVAAARLGFDGAPAVLSLTRDITERKLAETALRRSEERRKRAMEASGVALWDTDLRTGAIYLSERWPEIVGGEAGETHTTLGAMLKITHQEDLERVRAASARTMRGETREFSEEFRVRAQDGEWRWIHIGGRVVERDAAGRALRMIGTNYDITARKREERLLATEHAVTRGLALAETGSAGLKAAIAALGSAEDWDLARYFRVDESAGLLRFGEAWIANESRYRQLVEDSRELAFARGEGLAGRVWESGEPLWVPDMQQDSRVVQRPLTEQYGVRGAFVFPVHADSRVIGVCATFSREVRAPDERLMAAVRVIGSQLGQFLQRKQAEERLAWLAHSDTLTGLPNRALFRDRLDQALAQARRNDWQVGLLFADLDQFKRVNDSLGHGSGDEVLRIVGARLQSCLRAGDTVARLGGDEFAVLLPDLESADDARLVAQKMLAALNQPLDLGGRELFAGASIGITIYPHDALDAETLLQHADVAMYQAKGAARNSYRYFTPEMNADSARLLELERDLRHALERGEYELHFQPKADVTATRITGAEALLRWRRADGAHVPPVEFIPVLEDTGLIAEVGEWVLQEACRQLARWRAQGLDGLRVAVNVSAQQFRGGKLVDSVRRALDAGGCDSGCLELEVTESMVMHDVDVTIETLQALRALGVRVAVDDFGTGYSSLAYLKKLPVDVLKIDRAFIKDVTASANDAAITTAIIGMARTLGYEVVAEGVETALQRQFLEAQGCHQIQGYLLSRPMPAADFARWIAARPEN